MGPSCRACGGTRPPRRAAGTRTHTRCGELAWAVRWVCAAAAGGRLPVSVRRVGRVTDVHTHACGGESAVPARGADQWWDRVLPLPTPLRVGPPPLPAVSGRP